MHAQCSRDIILVASAIQNFAVLGSANGTGARPCPIAKRHPRFQAGDEANAVRFFPFPCDKRIDEIKNALL